MYVVILKCDGNKKQNSFLIKHEQLDRKIYHTDRADQFIAYPCMILPMFQNIVCFRKQMEHSSTIQEDP
jgi:hypothetical protein